MIKVKLEYGDLKKASALVHSKLLAATMKAADAAGKVYEDGYRAAVPVYSPSGTYGSAGARHHFIQLVNSIGRRTLEFKDRTGAYSVVGIVTASGDNWRMQSPQGLWIEEGTNDRWKANGQYTGFVHAYKIFANTLARYSGPAAKTVQSVMQREMKK
jgi:hypothetical protein